MKKLINSPENVVDEGHVLVDDHRVVVGGGIASRALRDEEAVRVGSPSVGINDDWFQIHEVDGGKRVPRDHVVGRP